MHCSIKIILLCSIFHICLFQEFPLLINNTGKPPTNGIDTKFTFGSCNKFLWDDDSSIFYNISKYNPDFYAWIGDAAYLENMIIYFLTFEYPGIERVRKRFKNSYEDPAYQTLLNTTKVIGVWDNHDSGQDFGDKNNKNLADVKHAFLDFLGEPKDSIRRTRAGGIYEAYDILSGNNHKIRLVLLDHRTNKDPFTHDNLGSEQWLWLENMFKKNDAQVVFIASGSQFIPQDRVYLDIWYGESLERLLTLVKQYRIPAILLSGDIHHAEFMDLPCGKETYGIPIVEFTSSGLSHTTKTLLKAGDLIDVLLMTSVYNDEHDRYRDFNFGAIEISWDEANLEESLISMQVKDYNASTVLKRDIRLKQLRHQKTDESKRCSSNLDTNKYLRLASHIINKLIFDFGRFWILLEAYKEILLIVYLVLCGLLLQLILMYKTLKCLCNNSSTSRKKYSLKEKTD